MTLQASEAHLRPRLQMLKHLSEQLLIQLEDTEGQIYRAKKPVRTPLRAQGQAVPVRLRSQKALKIPQSTQGLAVLKGQEVQELSYDQWIQLPEMHFEFLDFKGEPIGELQFDMGRVRTAQAGKVVKYALEYFAGILDFELSVWHFRALRRGKQIFLEAQQQSSAKNIRLKNMRYPRSQDQTWSGGFVAGMSSLDDSQQKGELQFLHWGPYLVNGQVHSISVPLLPQREAVSEAFLLSLNESLSAQNLKASWCNDGHLQIEAPAGQALQLEIHPDGLHRSQLSLPFQPQSLSPSPITEQLCFYCNQSPVEIELGSENLELNTLVQQLQEQLQAVDVQLELDEEQRLCLSAPPHQDLILREISPRAKALLGLEELALKSKFKQAQKHAEQWQNVAVQLQAQAQNTALAPLFDESNWPQELDFLLDSPINFYRWQQSGALLRSFLKEWGLQIAEMLKASPQITPPNPALQRSRVLNPPTAKTPQSLPKLKAENAEPDGEAKPSSFDHKI